MTADETKTAITAARERGDSAEVTRLLAEYQATVGILPAGPSVTVHGAGDLTWWTPHPVPRDDDGAAGAAWYTACALCDLTRVGSMWRGHLGAIGRDARALSAAGWRVVCGGVPVEFEASKEP